MLFADYSSTFNNIIPSKLITNMFDLGPSSKLCKWILDFLSKCSQMVRLGSHISMISTARLCAYPLLYSQYVHDCLPLHPANTIIKFADDTTMVGLISNGNEVTYRDEVHRMFEWCSHNIALNIIK